MRPSFEDLEHPGYSENKQQLRIFFDAEFTDLVADAKLISIGFVDETGERTFYAELTDAWRPDDVGLFTRDAVLPLLEGGAALLTLHELTDRLGAWLKSFGEPVKLATDSLEWDWPWIDTIFRTSGAWPRNVDTKPLLLIMSDLVRYAEFGQAIETAFHAGLRRHHALDDAKANRLGWLAAGGDIEKPILRR